MNFNANNVEVLQILSEALNVPQNLDEGLQTIVEMTCRLMGTKQCALLLRDEDREELIIRKSQGFSVDEIKEGHPLVVPDRIKNILWKIASMHQINWIDAGIGGIRFPMLVIPLKIKGEKIGLLFTSGFKEDVFGYNDMQRQLFILVASFASLIIENAKVHDYLQQQFAQRSKELLVANNYDENGVEDTRHFVVTSLSNPNKVVRLLAKSFYNELHKAGFSPGNITTAATQILDCITKNIE